MRFMTLVNCFKMWLMFGECALIGLFPYLNFSYLDKFGGAWCGTFMFDLMLMFVESIGPSPLHFFVAELHYRIGNPWWDESKTGEYCKGKGKKACPKAVGERTRKTEAAWSQTGWEEQTEAAGKVCLWFEASVMNRCSMIFLILMLEYGPVSEISGFNSLLKWMVTGEGFIQVKLSDLGIVMIHCGWYNINK